MDHWSSTFLVQNLRVRITWSAAVGAAEQSLSQRHQSNSRPRKMTSEQLLRPKGSRWRGQVHFVLPPCWSCHAVVFQWLAEVRTPDKPMQVLVGFCQFDGTIHLRDVSSECHWVQPELQQNIDQGRMQRRANEERIVERDSC